MNKEILKKEEQIIRDILVSARKIQEFLWGEMNDQAGLEEFKRMFRKRVSKIDRIETKNPHWKIEMKKRALQTAAIAVQVIYKLNEDSLEDGIHPTLESNLKEYAEPVGEEYPWTKEMEDIVNTFQVAAEDHLDCWHLNSRDHSNGIFTFLIPGKPIRRYKITVEEVDEIPLDFEIDEEGFLKE